MLIIEIILFIVLILLVVLTRGYKKQMFDKKDYLNPTACFLLEKCHLIQLFPKKDQYIFETVYIGEEGKKQLFLCRCRQMAGALAGLMGVLIFLIVAAMAKGQAQTGEMAEIKRPEHGRGTQTMQKDMILSSKNGERQEETLEFKVQEKAYTQTEWNEVLKMVQEYLSNTLPGKNQSLDYVTEPLILKESCPGTSVSISWETDPSYIFSDGTLKNTWEYKGNINKDGVLTELTAKVSYQDYRTECSFYAMVFPKQYSAIEQAAYKLRQAVKDTEQSTRGEEQFSLPESAGEYTVSVAEEQESTERIFIFLGFLVICLLIVLPIRRIKEEEKRRKRELMLDYPKLLNKFVLLTGAGLTIRGVFEKIAYEYNRKRQKGGKKRYVYEEITAMVRKIQNGGSETEELQAFGRRVKLPEYLKFTSILLQNHKKGMADILLILEHESVAAMEKNREQIRIMGEEAGTKLLLPMAAMLGIVFAVIMIPAFMCMST